MPTAAANGIELYYEELGDPEGPPLLLVMGLGAQLVAWDDAFAEGLADRGFRVVRFDNRDVGLSTHLDGDGAAMLMQALAGQDVTPPYLLSGQDVTPPYLLSDMAADAVGLLDHLGIAAAHLVGASMGGMIAQTIAIEHPDRVLSLTSIMSTTGEQEVGAPDAEILPLLMQPAQTEREAAVAQRTEVARAISSPDHFDEERARDVAARSFDRDQDPSGTPRQLLAIVASGSRAGGLAGLSVPTLVVHGRQDRLVNVSGGERTAELVPGAELILIDDMAHDLPPAHWARVIEAVTQLAGRVAPA